MTKTLLVLLGLIYSISGFTQGALELNLGIGQPVVKDFFFYNPSKVAFTGLNFTETMNLKPRPSVGVSYKYLQKWIRWDAGVQVHAYAFEFIPVLESMQNPGAVSVRDYTINLYGLLNVHWKGIALGIGPNYMFQTKPELTGSMDIKSNITANRNYSLGIKFNLDYTFALAAQTFVIGYAYDSFVRNPQLSAEVLFNEDGRDIFNLEFPKSFHYLKLGYVIQ